MSKYLWIFLIIIYSGNLTGQKIAAGLNEEDQLELFYIRNDTLFHRYQQQPGTNWSVENLYNSSVKKVFIAKGINGSLELFYIDGIDELYHSRLTSADSHWPDGSKVINHVTDLCMISDLNGKLHLFYIKTDHTVKYSKQIETGSGWSEATDFVDYAKRIAGGCNADGRLEVFFTANGDTLKHKYQLAAGGNWSDKTTFSGKALDINVAQNADGRLEVFYIAPDYKLFHKWQVAPSSGWDDAALFNDEARLVATNINYDGRIEIIYSNGEEILHHNWQTSASGGWGDGAQFGWYATSLMVVKNADAGLYVFYTGKDGLLYYRWQVERGAFWSSEYPMKDIEIPFTFDDYNIKPTFQNNPDWHINDHCFAKDPSGKWHMFGIMYPDPGSADTSFVNYFGHASADHLNQIPWVEESPGFYETFGNGDVLWAPHIVFHDGLYYMFYCNGGDLNSYKICLRTSEDLINWSDKQILFQDGFQGRDPMVLYVDEIGKWVIYYCATEYPSGGNFVVAYRTSDDLIHWGSRQIAYRDLHYGTDYGPTESPFVVKRGEYYYLFIGPRPYDYPSWFQNWEHPGYKGTDVFRSTSWNSWKNADFVGWIDAHAPEIINDDGNWYISHCGVKQGGLFIRRMYWKDGITPINEIEEFNTGNRYLKNCSPNPFKESAKINFVVNSGSNIKIDILDISGRKLLNLCDTYVEPGNYSIEWNIKSTNTLSVKTGVYFCRLIADGQQEMMKIVVI